MLVARRRRRRGLAGRAAALRRRTLRLLAWVIMPNHVHVLIETLSGFPLSTIVQSWKSFTRKEGESNAEANRGGSGWRTISTATFVTRSICRPRCVTSNRTRRPRGSYGSPKTGVGAAWECGRRTRSPTPRACGPMRGGTPALPGAGSADGSEEGPARGHREAGVLRGKATSGSAARCGRDARAPRGATGTETEVRKRRPSLCRDGRWPAPGGIRQAAAARARRSVEAIVQPVSRIPTYALLDPRRGRKPSTGRRCGSSRRSASTSATIRKRSRYGGKPERRSRANGPHPARARHGPARARTRQIHATRPPTPSRSVEIGGANLVSRRSTAHPTCATSAVPAAAGRSKTWRTSSSSRTGSRPSTTPAESSASPRTCPSPSATWRSSAPTSATPTCRSWER